ncbi:hypothetical protein [Sorangium sp. So ce1151]|uniref:hypothetical protein n=1 Tax=Sorangium sp. So ce1151 TaxID=3133332 RepID=UPI003F607EB5
MELNISFAAGGPGARCLDGFSETPQPPNNALHADEARADARDLHAELAPALLVAGTAPVLDQMGDGATLALELLVASVAPALDQVESH